MSAVWCSKCSAWRELFAPCECPRPQPAPASSSQLHRVVSVAAALASDRMRRVGGELGVTADEMTEASAIARSEVEA